MKEASGTTQISCHPESRRRISKSVTPLKNQPHNRPSPWPLSKRSQKIARIFPLKSGRLLTHWDQSVDACWCFLHSIQVNLCPSGYQLNLSIASQSAKELKLYKLAVQ